MPANAHTIYSVLIRIAAFDMIPTEKIYERMIEQLDTVAISDEDDKFYFKL